MRKLFFIIYLFSITVYAQSAENKDTLLTEMNRNIKAWMGIYNSGDAAGFKDLYSEDAKYISSHVPGLTAEGRENIIKYFQSGIDLGGHLENVEIISMEHSCDIITLLCRYEANNAGAKAIGRNLLVLKKIINTWLIVLHMTVV